MAALLTSAAALSGGEAAVGAEVRSAEQRARFRLLHSFGQTATDNLRRGATPNSAVIQANDGFLYGTTANGGRFGGSGTLYRLTASHAFEIVHSFDWASPVGTTPYAKPLQASDGLLYGTAYQGGGTTDSRGSVYRIGRTGVADAIHVFAGGGDGGGPVGELIEADDGRLYGTTVYGGIADGGTVFRIGPDSAFEQLHRFGSQPGDGTNSYAALLQGRDGLLYGTTVAGGAYGLGTVFRMSLDGAVTTLHSFNRIDGAAPLSALIQVDDFEFFGTTQRGGTDDAGTIFRISVNGVLDRVFSFSRSGPEGCYPVAPLLQASDGRLYGTSCSDYPDGVMTVYALTDDHRITVLHSFSPGCELTNGLLETNDDALIGTTFLGGDFNLGSVYRIIDAPRRRG